MAKSSQPGVQQHLDWLEWTGNITDEQDAENQDGEDSKDLENEDIADWTTTQDRKGKGKAVEIQEGISKYMNVLFLKC